MKTKFTLYLLFLMCVQSQVTWLVCWTPILTLTAGTGWIGTSRHVMHLQFTVTLDKCLLNN